MNAIQKQELMAQYDQDIKAKLHRDRAFVALKNVRDVKKKIMLEAEIQYRYEVETRFVQRASLVNKNSIAAGRHRGLERKRNAYEYEFVEIAVILNITPKQAIVLCSSAIRKIKCILEKEGVYVDIEASVEELSRYEK